MTLPFPEYDTADTVWPELDQSEREQVQAVAAAPLGDATKAAIALGGAYLVYRQFMKNRLTKRLRGEDEMSPRELEQAASQAYQDFVPVWTYMVVPSVFSSMLVGVEEAGQVLGNNRLRDLAYTYSWNLGSYINNKAIDSAKRGFQAQVNRKVDRKRAKNNVVKAFGTTLPGMRSLVGIWTEDEPESMTEEKLTSTKAARVRKVIGMDANTRAKMIGNEETFSLKSIGKQMAWASAQQQGLIPMTATRQWITAKDELVCDECGPLHKQEMSIGEPFVVNGKKVWAPSLHPNCRCHVRLKANLGQHIASGTTRLLTDTGKQWTSADDSVDLQSVGKADNDWETQPRGKSGRFGARPTEYKDPDEPDLQSLVNQAQTKDLEETTVAPAKPSLFEAVNQDYKPSLFQQGSLYQKKSLFTPSLYESKQATSVYSDTATPSLYQPAGVSLYGKSRSLFQPRAGQSIFEEDEEDFIGAVERDPSVRLYGIFDYDAGNQDHYDHDGEERITTRDMRVTSDPDELNDMIVETQNEIFSTWMYTYYGRSQMASAPPPIARQVVIDAPEYGEGFHYIIPASVVQDVLQAAADKPAGATVIHGSVPLPIFDTSLYNKMKGEKDRPPTARDGILPAPEMVARETIYRALELDELEHKMSNIRVLSFNQVPREPGWSKLTHGTAYGGGPRGVSGTVSDYYRVAEEGYESLDAEVDEAHYVYRLEGIDQDHQARLSDDRLA